MPWPGRSRWPASGARAIPIRHAAGSHTGVRSIRPATCFATKRIGSARQIPISGPIWPSDSARVFDLVDQYLALGAFDEALDLLVPHISGGRRAGVRARCGVAGRRSARGVLPRLPEAAPRPVGGRGLPPRVCVADRRTCSRIARRTLCRAARGIEGEPGRRARAIPFGLAPFRGRPGGQCHCRLDAGRSAGARHADAAPQSGTGAPAGRAARTQRSTC